MTKKVKIGNVVIGGGERIKIQSMTKSLTQDKEETLKQIKNLERAGCDICRIAIPDEESARLIKYYKERTTLPIVADIHFDYRLAILSIKEGADKIRINPGNISKDKIKEIIKCAKDYGIPIRIGVNAGSLEKDILEKYGRPTPDALFESIKRNVEFFLENDFDNLVLSAKSSNVLDTIKVYRLIHKHFDFPLHIGVTEAGPSYIGVTKSAIGISSLLMEGIGDTIRVSLSAPPEEEVYVAKEILKAVSLLKGPEIISCPMCGRAEFDVERVAKELMERLINFEKPVKIAIMGCVVNGPGEAKEADVGVTGSRGVGVIFKHGKIIKRVREKELLDELIKIICEEL